VAVTVGRGAPGVFGAREWPARSGATLLTFALRDDRTDRNATTLTAVTSVSRMARPQRGKRPVQGGTGPRTLFRFTPTYITPQERTRHSERTSCRAPRVAMSESGN
jgi:hypothetical protein